MNNELKNEIIYEVYWYGPYDPDSLEDVHSNNVLYMICGTHGLYGRNVPLYIGKTERSIQARLNEHRTWIEDEPDPVKVYTAVIGKFMSWLHNSSIVEYLPLDRSVIEAVESLLIYSHQPVYNQPQKKELFCYPVKLDFSTLDIETFYIQRFQEDTMLVFKRSNIFASGSSKSFSFCTPLS